MGEQHRGVDNVGVDQFESAQVVFQTVANYDAVLGDETHQIILDIFESLVGVANEILGRDAAVLGVVVDDLGKNTAEETG